MDLRDERIVGKVEEAITNTAIEDVVVAIYILE